MRSDYRYTSDTRGHHCPLSLHLCLPFAEAEEFIAEVEARPDFMEEVFQAMYPGFTELLPRPQAKGIKLLDLGQLDESKLGIFREYLRAGDVDEDDNLNLTPNVCSLLVDRKPFKDLSFSKPVGEIEAEVE